MRNEVHICHTDVGHNDSVDCWCEPVRIYWYTNKNNILMLVVEHNDDSHIHRLTRTAVRERDKHLTGDGDGNTSVMWGLDAPWITRALDRTEVKGRPDGHE